MAKRDEETDAANLPTVPGSRSRFQFGLLKLAAGCGCAIAIVTVLFVAYGLIIKLRNMGEEYGTASIIQTVQEFVQANNRLPTDSTEVAPGFRWQDSTDIRFDLTAEQLNENPLLIYEYIQPKSRRYYTYPHAKRNLEDLLLEVRVRIIEPQGALSRSPE